MGRQTASWSPRRRGLAISLLLCPGCRAFLQPPPPLTAQRNAQGGRATLPPKSRPRPPRTAGVVFAKKRRKDLVIQPDWFSNDDAPSLLRTGGGSSGGGGMGANGSGGASADLEDYYMSGEPYRRGPTAQEEAELDQVLSAEFRGAIVKPPGSAPSGGIATPSAAAAAAASAASALAAGLQRRGVRVSTTDGGADPFYFLEDDDEEDGRGINAVNGVSPSAVTGRRYAREQTENGIIYYTPVAEGEDQDDGDGVEMDGEEDEDDGSSSPEANAAAAAGAAWEDTAAAAAGEQEDDDIVMVEDGAEDGVQVFEVGGDEPLLDVSHVSMRSESLEEFKAQKAQAAGSDTAAEIDPVPSSATFQTVMVVGVRSAFERALVGNFQNFGVEVKANFDDFEPTSADVAWTLEEMAAYQCREIFAATGIPVVAEATSFEVEAVHGGVGRKNARYRFNRIGPHVDKLVQALAPVSDPRRICSFRTVLCYYDGQQELFETAEADVAMVYASSAKALITAASATLDMCEVLHSMSPELEFLPQVMRSPSETKRGAGEAANFAGATMLRDTMLKLGRVLPNNIIDVSSFMETMVDIALMQECAKELADRFKRIKPNKILTVATTGLIIATPMAMLLQVPVVYARKQRTMVMSDYYISSYSSKTQGTNRELVVSKAHLSPEDRVLIVDDFLSAGSCQDALLRIISDAGATPVGIAVLVEKAYEAGRQFLSGYNLPIESLAKVMSVEDGRINLDDA